MTIPATASIRRRTGLTPGAYHRGIVDSQPATAG